MQVSKAFIGVIICNTVTKGVQYHPPTQYLYLDQKRKMGLVKRIKKQIDKFDLIPEDLDFNKKLIINKQN